MPVKTSNSIHFNREDYLDDMANLDVNDLYNTAPLLSDDIWKKFELDLPFGDDFFDDIANGGGGDASITSSPSYIYHCKIRNHDCMWAGHCGSKEHPADEPRLSHNRLVAVAPVVDKPPVALRQSANNNNNTSRSLLISRTTVHKAATPAATAGPIVASPDSPPMSDDEETKGKTATLQLLHDAISECDLDEDSDLCEYFEEDDLLSDPVEDAQPRALYARDNDHSYHKDKNSSMRVMNLGIETPSDSEEEIDVVSVGEKQNAARMVSTLPHNPTSLDRQQIQKTMATAISNKKLTGSIKTILPVRKSSTEQHSPTKRKAPDGRGMKRSKYQQHRLTTSSGSPYKKRGGAASYNHSSDSEPEPSEKRSLHNNMERQRRIDLRNAFEDLRSLVPEVSKKERAAKVAILREAAIYCDQLGNASEGMKRQVEELRRHQDRLRARVSQLRKNLAAKHR